MMKKIITLALASIICTEAVYPVFPDYITSISNKSTQAAAKREYLMTTYETQLRQRGVTLPKHLPRSNEELDALEVALAAAVAASIAQQPGGQPAQNNNASVVQSVTSSSVAAPVVQQPGGPLAGQQPAQNNGAPIIPPVIPGSVAAPAPQLMDRSCIKILTDNPEIVSRCLTCVCCGCGAACSWASPQLPDLVTRVQCKELGECAFLCAAVAFLANRCFKKKQKNN